MPRKSARLLVILVGLLYVSVGAGCKSNPVGRPCFIEVTDPNTTIVSAPALECQSGTCIHVAGRSPDMCTGTCDSDNDCDTSPESPCEMGFACIVPVVTGNFCCEKLCVCRDYLTGSEPQEPAACVASNAANECCNLPGRRENPQMYPGCAN